MKVFLAALLLVGLCVLGLCTSIILRKDGHFPQFDVGSNEQMRARGITCFKDEDAKYHRKSCKATRTDACKDCSFYQP